jgi:predicted enzyme related to lactoylglutathione lyase
MNIIGGIETKYMHTNLVAFDWRRLSDFYIKVFGCVPVPPERDLAGEWLDSALGMSNTHIQGVHLRLPGYDDNGPTLEVFQYNHAEEAIVSMPNRPGYGHIAFSVENVEDIIKLVLEMGGSMVGNVAKVHLLGVGHLEFAYMRDPENNIIEIQKIRKLNDNTIID